MSYGKSIELFLVNGSADSLITAELSNWNGKAIKIPNIDNFRLNVYNKIWHIICKLQHKEFNGNQCSLEESWMIDGYVTVKYIAEKWELKPRTVQIMCADGRIPGAVKFGRDWAIPQNAKKTIDGRIISGNYIDYRKSKKRGDSSAWH